jgi:hypothetical protein
MINTTNLSVEPGQAHHTDDEREYAYDSDPLLGSGTGQLLAAASERHWTVVDMAADWSSVFPSTG